MSWVDGTPQRAVWIQDDKMVNPLVFPSDNEFEASLTKFGLDYDVVELSDGDRIVMMQSRSSKIVCPRCNTQNAREISGYRYYCSRCNMIFIFSMDGIKDVEIVAPGFTFCNSHQESTERCGCDLGCNICGDDPCTCCPYCHTPGCHGSCRDGGGSTGGGSTGDGTGTGSTTGDTALGNNVNNIVTKTGKSFSKIEVVYKSESYEGLHAAVVVTGKTDEILYGDKVFTFYVSPTFDSNSIQYKIIVLHEINHLDLYNTIRKAGNKETLLKENPDLYHLIYDFTPINIERAHHLYFGKTVDDNEAMLRLLYPEENPDFYRYGKWGGGATLSPEFEALPDEEKKAINDYLTNNNL